MIFCWARWLIEENSLINWQAGTWLYRVARPKELKIENPRRFSNFSWGHTLYDDCRETHDARMPDGTPPTESKVIPLPYGNYEDVFAETEAGVWDT